MNNGLIVLTAALMVLTGIGHSWLGERKVISTMMAIADGKVLSRVQKRFLRACWHIGTISWVATAAMLLCLSLPPRELQLAILAINGFAFVLIGSLNCLISRGRSPGWVACLLVAAASVAAAVLL